MPSSPQYPLRSPRLLVRPLAERDAAALLAYRSLPEVCRWVPFEPMDAATIEKALRERWSRSALDAEGQALMLGAERADTGEVVGDVMLRWESAEHRLGEVGYMFHPEHSGLGYATEAVHAVLHLAFDELAFHRVVARVDLRNLSSARLLRRLGMRQEAHLVQNEWFKGGWSDELDFALLESEWHSRHAHGCDVLG
jgi:RimJ/RimL family protein N-acetyltransferase